MSIPSSVERWRSLATTFVQAHPVLTADEILSIVWSESFGNPLAFNPGDPSWGLMQITAPIAKAYGGFTDDDITWHTDPEKNMKAGAGYLAFLKTKYGESFSDYRWIAMYNAGEPAVLRGFKDQPYMDSFMYHFKEFKGETA